MGLTIRIRQIPKVDMQEAEMVTLITSSGTRHCRLNCLSRRLHPLDPCLQQCKHGLSSSRVLCISLSPHHQRRQWKMHNYALSVRHISILEQSSQSFRPSSFWVLPTLANASSLLLLDVCAGTHWEDTLNVHRRNTKSTSTMEKFVARHTGSPTPL